MHLSVLDRLWLWLRFSWCGKILAEHNTEPTELMLGGFLKWLVGTWLLLPFNSFRASPAFAGLVPFSEITVALFLMAAGLLHMLALKHGDPFWRMVSAQMGSLIWASLGLSFLYVNPGAIGAMLFIMAGVCQAWCYIRLSLQLRGVQHGRSAGRI